MFWNVFGGMVFPDEEIYSLPQFRLLFFTLAFQRLLFTLRFLDLEIPDVVMVSEIAAKGLATLLCVDTPSPPIKKYK